MTERAAAVPGGGRLIGRDAAFALPREGSVTTDTSVVQTWTTTSAPGREVSYWRDAVCDAIIDLEIEANADQGFSANLRKSPCGPISFSSIQVGAGQRLLRSRSAIARSPCAQFELLYFSHCDALLVHAGREARLRSNQCVLLDGSRPYIVDMKGPSRNISIHLPSKWLAMRLPDVEHALARPIDCSSPYGNILARLVSCMADLPSGSYEHESLLADQIIGAFCLALGPSPTSLSQHTNRLHQRITRALRDLSNDQSLDSTKLATEVGISVRYLQSILSRAGTSFGEELQTARLGSAIRMLRDPRFRSLSIGEIAFRAGYSDPSHFCRRFKAATKMTPTNYRMAETG